MKTLNKSNRPQVIDEEIVVPTDDVLISVTDPNGLITDANDIFVKISGYTKDELMGANHNLIRHPDMPRVMFDVVWKHIKNRENIMAVVKNLAKDGRYYWVITDFVTKVDSNRNVINYTAYRRSPKPGILKTIIPMYKALVAIEEFAGMAAAEHFLTDFLERRKESYDDFIESLIVETCEREDMVRAYKASSEADKKGFFNRFFGI